MLRRSALWTRLLIGLLIYGQVGPISAENSAQRIISLAPHLTEQVYTAGAGDKLVGVIDYSDYPDAAKTLPSVGNFAHFNIEKIVALKPDLILAWQSGNREKDLDKLKQLGLNVWTTDTHRLADIPRQIRAIGQRAGTESQAIPAAQALEQTLATLKSRYQNAPEIRVFYQIWAKPYITINRDQFISQGMALCHGRNVFADLPTLSGEVSLESILKADPQVILLGGYPEKQTLWQQAWQKVPGLTAVEKHQIYPMVSDWLQRPTARFINALPEVCQTLDKARVAYGLKGYN
jgi:iron complex transport system substrate-binding protein